MFVNKKEIATQFAVSAESPVEYTLFGIGSNNKFLANQVLCAKPLVKGICAATPS